MSPTIFAFDTLLLLFAMMVIGGVGSARGVVLGVCALLLVDQKLLELGAMRMVVIAGIMLLIVLVAPAGLAGIPDQLRATGRATSGSTRGFVARKTPATSPQTGRVALPSREW